MAGSRCSPTRRSTAAGRRRRTRRHGRPEDLTEYRIVRIRMDSADSFELRLTMKKAAATIVDVMSFDSGALVSRRSSEIVSRSNGAVEQVVDVVELWPDRQIA
jgi:hypothetical protein